MTHHYDPLPESTLQTRDNHLRAASLASKLGWGGALLVIGGAIWASYAIRGEMIWLILLPAGFMAFCHWLGCHLFARYFKGLANEAEQAKRQSPIQTPNSF